MSPQIGAGSQGAGSMGLKKKGSKEHGSRKAIEFRSQEPKGHFEGSREHGNPHVILAVL